MNHFFFGFLERILSIRRPIKAPIKKNCSGMKIQIAKSLKLKGISKSVRYTAGLEIASRRQHTRSPSPEQLKDFITIRILNKAKIKPNLCQFFDLSHIFLILTFIIEVINYPIYKLYGFEKI